MHINMMISIFKFPGPNKRFTRSSDQVWVVKNIYSFGRSRTTDRLNVVSKGTWCFFSPDVWCMVQLRPWLQAWNEAHYPAPFYSGFSFVIVLRQYQLHLWLTTGVFRIRMDQPSWTSQISWQSLIPLTIWPGFKDWEWEELFYSDSVSSSIVVDRRPDSRPLLSGLGLSLLILVR